MARKSAAGQEELRPWHRLFGLSWQDFFHGTPFRVLLEEDVSLQQQRLDVAVLRPGAAPLPRRLPDGFENLAPYNLITFKSYNEALETWPLKELGGYYTAYRKQVSPSPRELLPEADFRLFAVCVRSPHNLAQKVPLKRLKDGVYSVPYFDDEIRIVVVHELPLVEHNALFHLFSAQPEQVAYGAQHYRPHSGETSSLLWQLFQRYQLEGIPMPDSLEALARDTAKLILREMPPEEVLQVLSPEERLKGLPPEERLKGLPPEERLKGLSPEELEALEVLARRLRTQQSPPKPE